MKIRSQGELQDYLDKTLAWRKRELTTIRFKILKTKREHEQAALLRAALPMLYAHWEGFIKSAAQAYIEYVSRQQMLLRDLQHNSIALAIRKVILDAGVSRKVHIHKKVVDEIVGNLDRVAILGVEGVIDVESNLSSLVLRDIMATLGLEFNETWQKKVPLIDHQLLKNRNEVVHGEQTPIDMPTYQQLHVFVLESLEQFKAELENAAARKLFRK